MKKSGSVHQDGGELRAEMLAPSAEARAGGSGGRQPQPRKKRKSVSSADLSGGTPNVSALHAQKESSLGGGGLTPKLEEYVTFQHKNQIKEEVQESEEFTEEKQKHLLSQEFQRQLEQIQQQYFQQLSSEEEYILALQAQEKEARIQKLVDIFDAGDADKELLRQHLDIIDHAATQIQKTWRGYYTRKLIQQYINLVFEMEREQQLQAPVQEQDEENADDDCEQGEYEDREREYEQGEYEDREREYEQGEYDDREREYEQGEYDDREREYE